jgi:hypothetical protein
VVLISQGDTTTQAMHFVIPSGTVILPGFQTASSAFFISVLERRATRSTNNAVRQVVETEAA